MLDHLIDFEPEVEHSSAIVTPFEKVTPTAHANAKISTADWLKELGALDDEELATELDTTAARGAFANLVSAAPAEITHQALARVETPAAVQHLVGMLTAYDWEFVAQAKELRGYCVAKLVEETNNPTASIRLKALALLGKVTEVGLFTDKVEVKKAEVSDTELDARIKEKLNRFAQIVEVTDVPDSLDDEAVQASLEIIDDTKPDSNGD